MAPAMLNRVHGELVKAYAQPELRKQLTEQFGMDVIAGTPEAMSKFLTAEIARWGKVVKDNNIKVEG